MKRIVLFFIAALLVLSCFGCSGKQGEPSAPYIVDGYWYVDGVNTNVKAEGVDGANGANGLDGKNGVDGKDGKDGVDGKDGLDGKNGKDGVDGKDGNGILSITLTSSTENIDTYTITFTNGETATFTVTNAASSTPTETFALLEKGNGYVLPSVAVGKPVAFGTFSTHSKYVIPPHVSVTVTMKTGGSYGFARTDADDAVLEICSNADHTQYTFAARAYVTYLYASDVKVAGINDWSTLDAADTYWAGKSIWWCGTSIPAGGYPLLVGEELGATVFQEAVGGSMCRANVSTGDYNGANISNITSSLSMTLAEAQAFIEQYDTLRSLSKNASWPTELSESNQARILAGSFETKLLPYLDGRKPMPDLFVIDHGHNDWKYLDANGNIDIELEPTVENIQNGLLAEDTYMVANNYENLKAYFGDLSGIPENQLAEFAASVNRNCYKGAVNFILTLILSRNPQARIVFISNYEKENGYNKAYHNVIDAQVSLAEEWCFPIFEIHKYLGYSDKLIPGSKEYMSKQYPTYTFDKDVTVYEVYNVDKVHPSSDTTGRANEIYAGLIAAFLRTVR